MQGSVNGGPQIILRIEGLLVLIAGAFGFSSLDYGWSIYFLYFLVPDISFVGYLFGSKAGAAFYNAAHSYALPIGVLLIGSHISEPMLLAASFIWLSHVGFDRALGFGLKYSKGFGFTHLGVIGKGQENA